MIERAAPVREEHTLITADAGYFSDDNVKALHEQNIPALIADSGMRKRDERFAQQGQHKAQGDVLYDKRGATQPIRLFKPGDFEFHGDNTARCPVGKTLTSNGTIYGQRGHKFQRYEAAACGRQACALRGRCLRKPAATRGRQVARLEPRAPDPQHPSQRMRDAIDSPRGRALYSRRTATVEPVFANTGTTSA